VHKKSGADNRGPLFDLKEVRVRAAQEPMVS
jgi:hypothetical protein